MANSDFSAIVRRARRHRSSPCSRAPEPRRSGPARRVVASPWASSSPGVLSVAISWVSSDHVIPAASWGLEATLDIDGYALSKKKRELDCMDVILEQPGSNALV